jgi:hypothetical protein
MPVRLNGSTSGFTELSAPAVAGNNSIAFPTTSGTAVVNGANSAIVSGTAQNSTSGTSIDFTGIPSWVKRVTVMFSGVSTSGTSIKQIQIGSTTIDTSSYLGSGIQLTDGFAANANTSATGFQIRSALAADLLHGAVTISLVTGNTWCASGALTDSSRSAGYLVGGTKSLSGTLDRVRITTVNNTDTFDAGSINILYE